jgi:hypothetical protein
MFQHLLQEIDETRELIIKRKRGARRKTFMTKEKDHDVGKK